MNISINNNQPTFSAKFVNNAAFRDVITYAEKNGKMGILDGALNNLSHANKGDILLIHGQVPAGIFSSFTMNNRSVQNLALGAKTAPETSFNAIIDLSTLGRKFRKLVGGDVKTDYNADDIIKKYSVFQI